MQHPVETQRSPSGVSKNTSSGGSSGGSSGAALQLKASLGGLDFAAQESMLAPVQRKRAGASVQREETPPKPANDRTPGVDVQIGDLRQGEGKVSDEQKANATPEGLTQGCATPKDHPYYTTFVSRVLGLFAKIGAPPGQSPQEIADSLWEQVVNATLAQQGHTMNEDGTGPAEGYINADNRIAMDSDAYQSATKEFAAVCQQMAAYSSTQFAQARTFGFWSGPGAKPMAEKVCDLTLETSGVGGLLDQIPDLSTEKNAWGPLWGGLSRAYAAAIGQQMGRDIKIHAFKGKGAVATGNVYAEVESKALQKGAEDAGIALESVLKFHAVAGLSNEKPWEVDLNVQGGDFLGTIVSDTDEGKVIDALTPYWAAKPPKADAPVS